MTPPRRLEAALRRRLEGGGKCLVPYVTGGLREDWLDVIRAIAIAGADAVEVGIPFSDPVMDGPTIQEASDRALRSGVTPASILDELATVDAGVPLVVMTYYNIVFRFGHERFARTLVSSGVAAAIVPDLPLEESGAWAAAADLAGVETVMLAAPPAPDERLPRVCERAHGFVYGVGLLGVTGERRQLSRTAIVMAQRLKSVTDKPVLVGVGISSPAQAAEVCAVADGVVVGSTIVRRLLEGADPEQIGAAVAEFRESLDVLAGERSAG